MSNPTTLAGALRRLFDESGLTRAEWATLLGVSTAALSQWANAKQTPTPRHLDWLQETAQTMGGIPDEVRLLMRQVYQLPLTKVLPNVRPNMGRTLEEYVQRQQTEEIMKTVMALPATDQRRIVELLVAEIRQAVMPAPPAAPDNLIRFPAMSPQQPWLLTEAA